MAVLDDAVSLAIAGTKLTPKHVEVLTQATVLDLIDLGLSFPEIEVLRRLVQRETQRNKSQDVTYPFAEGKAKLEALLKEELGAMLDLPVLGAEEELSFTDDVGELGGGEVFDVGYEAGQAMDDAGDCGGHGHGASKMARQQLYTIVQAAQGLYDSLDDDDDIPAWSQSHVAQAQQMLGNVAEYLEYKALTREMEHG